METIQNIEGPWASMVEPSEFVKALLVSEAASWQPKVTLLALAEELVTTVKHNKAAMVACN